LPFDGATLGRLGASEGPKALRAAARMLKVHRFGGPPPRFTPHISGAALASVGASASSKNDAMQVTVPAPSGDAETLLLPTGSGAMRATVKPTGTVMFVPLPGMTSLSP